MLVNLLSGELVVVEYLLLDYLLIIRFDMRNRGRSVRICGLFVCFCHAIMFKSNFSHFNIIVAFHA